MRAFTIKPVGVFNGIAVSNDPLGMGRAVLLDKNDPIYVTVDEKTFGATVLRIFRAQVTDCNVLIHDPGVEDDRALLFFDMPRLFRGSTGYAIKPKYSDGGFTQFAVSNSLISVLRQTEGPAPKYLAIVKKDTVINIRSFGGRNLRQNLFIHWDGIYPKHTTNIQEVFGPDPFSKFLPQHYENVK